MKKLLLLLPILLFTFSCSSDDDDPAKPNNGPDYANGEVLRVAYRIASHVDEWDDAFLTNGKLIEQNETSIKADDIYCGSMIQYNKIGNTVRLNTVFVFCYDKFGNEVDNWSKR